MLASEQNPDRHIANLLPHNRAWNISTAFYLWSATVRAEGTQNISTAEVLEGDCYFFLWFESTSHIALLCCRPLWCGGSSDFLQSLLLDTLGYPRQLF